MQVITIELKRLDNAINLTGRDDAEGLFVAISQSLSKVAKLTCITRGEVKDIVALDPGNAEPIELFYKAVNGYIRRLIRELLPKIDKKLESLEARRAL